MFTDQDIIVDKLKELSDLLKAHGLNNQIDIRCSDANGNKILQIDAYNGYWQSSTSQCNDYDFAESIEIDFEENTSTNWSSSSNC